MTPNDEDNMKGGPEMKIRVFPVLISFVISFAVLFGGYYLYQSYALQSPLNEKISNIEGVVSAETNLNDEQVVITLELEPNASLRSVMEEIEVSGGDYIKHREIQLNITNSSSESIDQWWSSMLFDVAEAMETKQYSTIPVLLKQGESEVEGLETFAEMDDQHVYVRLNKDGAERFIILPRTPAVYAGWSNE